MNKIHEYLLLFAFGIITISYIEGRFNNNVDENFNCL
jgi:hypothetical protein